MLSFLFTFLLIYFLTYLYTAAIRIDQFRFQAGGVGCDQNGF